MFTFNNYEIDLRSIPGEICLTFYICDCPCHCPGCSSPWLAQLGKRELTINKILKALQPFPYVTCVLFMGGDNDYETLIEFSTAIRAAHYKVAFYSGREYNDLLIPYLDYYKTGPWKAALGPLNSPTTNQRLYCIDTGWNPIDITNKFWTKENEFKPQQAKKIDEDRTEWLHEIGAADAKSRSEKE